MQNDSIDRQAAIDAIVTWTVEDRPDIEMPTDLIDRIGNLPSVPPEQKKGEWIEIMDVDEFGEPYPCGVQCSECGFCSVNLDNFCPNCGSYNGGEQE